MKRILFLTLLMITTGMAYSQITYYYVGGPNPASFHTAGSSGNWNTMQNGSGTFRSSATAGVTDILIVDGTNIGGAVQTTGAITAPLNGGITCGQFKLVNNATLNLTRTSTGTGSLVISGGDGDDFIVESGSTFSLVSTVASLRVTMNSGTSGRVTGAVVINTNQATRFENALTVPAIPATMVFASGASFTTNMTASSYAFGNATQSTEKWVTFQAGAHLYYDGGFSPNGNNSIFSPINFELGSTWHHRANNPVGSGIFFARKSFGNVIVENNATLTAEGSIYRINNLTINNGSSFITHSSGQTVVLGNMTVNGSFTGNAGNNELLFAGFAPQTVSGTGTIAPGKLIVADNANVRFDKGISVTNGADIFGSVNFTTQQLTGTGNFRANTTTAPVNGTGNTTAGSFLMTNHAGIATTNRGLGITGPGIAPNTAIVSFSAAGDTLYMSQAALATATGVGVAAASDKSVLQTANANGFDPATGSVTLTGTQTFENGINYIIDGATAYPFGVTTGSSNTVIDADFVVINAPVTLNKSIGINTNLAINDMLTLRPLDTVHIKTGAIINGGFTAGKHIATGYNTSNGQQGVVQYDGIATTTNIPVGTATHYMPVIVSPTGSADFVVAAFDGITNDGTPNGTPLTAAQKLTVLDAVWNINRLNGAGATDLTLWWSGAQEGTTFSTLPNTDIGLIRNVGAAYNLPVGVANNTTNTVTATINTFGAFSVGAVPQSDPFVFNALPAKIYGDADFNGGASSLNTTQPIVYTSNNTSVATIVAGNIHIVGAGTSDITASQASDGVFPAASITRTLTVDKAPLTIKADNQSRFEATANPTLTITYTGFVLGEGAAALLTPTVISTTATTASAPGTYPITVSGATSNNYSITFTNGVMTVIPKQTQTITFAALAAKTYGNADFAVTATSTNNTIPVVLTSSNTNIATVTGNTIHIVGAGTVNITASQAGSAGYFAATDVVRALVINKAALTIRVRDTVRNVGEANPSFTVTYTGFVLGQSAANLLSPLTVTTAADINSAPGYYPITLGGATSNNYAVTFVNGRLTVLPPGAGTMQYINAFMPNNSTLTVRLFSPEPRLADILLFDYSGRPVARKNIFMPAGFINADLAIGTIPSGIYIISVKGNGVNLTKTVPLIKQ